MSHEMYRLVPHNSETFTLRAAISLPPAHLMCHWTWVL